MFAKMPRDGWQHCGACHFPIHDWIIRFEGDKYHRRCVPTNGRQSGAITKVLIGWQTPVVIRGDPVIYRGEEWTVREVKAKGGGVKC